MSALVTGLADGVFDPLHAGHLAYLEQAALLCDDLVVQVSNQTKRRQFLTRQDRARLVSQCGYRVVAHPSTAEALRTLRPQLYIKGADWRDRALPEAEQAVCRDLGIQIHYVDGLRRDSSTRLLQEWASWTAQDGVQALNNLAQVQEAVPFDVAAQGYLDTQARDRIEGEHPDILARLCRGMAVLDVGCGPGHLVRLLRDRGVVAEGIDPAIPMGVYPMCYRISLKELSTHYDVAVCREVLEHIPVREWGAFLFHLFRVADRVYLTTRFHLDPPHPYALTTDYDADPSHITVLPQPFLRSLCVAMGGVRDRAWELALDWQHKGRVLVYQVRK